MTKDSPAIVSTNFSNPIDDTLINCIWKVDDPFEQGLGKTRWIEYEKIEILGSDTNDEYCSNARITQGSIRGKLVEKISINRSTNLIVFLFHF